ncbi:CYTH domain-containing protein [Mesorhizobium sp. CAU 1741]|uniref:CYTH domain-containing protein n=1 Tax=Mesorhizobium sp. CAU 1741 TaxID=3140366 RepID=UPI00325B2103
MAKEIERKFLVRDDGWRKLADAGVSIVQFYVAASDDRSVRIRIRDDRDALLTLKFGSAALERDEFEYPVPLDDAREMQGFAVGRVIEKTRHIVIHCGKRYEVDRFAGALDGLVVAELETPEMVADEDLPPWLGREVTGEAAFYNAALALNGIPGD